MKSTIYEIEYVKIAIMCFWTLTSTKDFYLVAMRLLFSKETVVNILRVESGSQNHQGPALSLELLESIVPPLEPHLYFNGN